MATKWTIEAYCEAQSPSDISLLASASSQLFLQALNLSTTHPFCGAQAPVPYERDGIPGQGPLLHNDHLESWWDVVVTVVAMGVPSLAAMAELWLRLFASMSAPLGIAHLLRDEFKPTTKTTTKGNQPDQQQRHVFTSLACLLSVASSVVLLTDTLYILELGPRYGAALLVCSTVLALRASYRHGLVQTRFGVWGLLLLCLFLSVDLPNGTVSFGGDPEDSPQFLQEGLYYDYSRAAGIVDQWPASFRTYTPESGASTWMPSGDSRTGLPFLLNGHAPSPAWTRVWLPVQDGEEVVALDIAFPETGHDASKPVYMILHGLNGGSSEEYVKDFTWRRTKEGSTCVVMVARGLMDLPVRGWDVFHGARWTDAHETANALRAGLAKDQMLAGVGFSMGGTFVRSLLITTVSCADRMLLLFIF
jgi:hypothetical protein